MGGDDESRLNALDAVVESNRLVVVLAVVCFSDAVATVVVAVVLVVEIVVVAVTGTDVWPVDVWFALVVVDTMGNCSRSTP